MRVDRIENHLARERQCRNNADRASLPYVRKLHLDLAEMHADKRRELESRRSYLAANIAYAAPVDADEARVRVPQDGDQRPVRAA